MSGMRGRKYCSLKLWNGCPNIQHNLDFYVDCFMAERDGRNSMQHVLTMYLFSFQNNSIFVTLTFIVPELMCKEQLLLHSCMQS